jgi:hypothetical protein
MRTRNGVSLVLCACLAACASNETTSPNVVVIEESAGGAAGASVGGSTQTMAGGAKGGAGESAAGGAHAGEGGGAAGSNAGKSGADAGKSGADVGQGGADAGKSGADVGQGGADAGKSGAGVGEGGAAGGGDVAGASGTSPGGAAGATCAGVTLEPTLTFQLASAPFPSTDHPSVAVHVPSGFLPCDKPGVIVFFHGFDNCVVNAIGSTNTACTPGGAVRQAYHLSDQLDAAKVNAILVAIELDFDMATGDPGALTMPGSLHDLLHELFTQHLDALLGQSLDVEDLDRVVIGTHSGGYWATEAVLTNGMVPQITEVDLYDSLYAYESTFEAFITDDIQDFSTTSPNPKRFFDAYTDGGGTLANSQSMADAVTSDLANAGLSSSLLNDEMTDTLTDSQYGTPVIFKHSSLAHDDVPRYYFGLLAPHSGFQPLP